MRSKDDPCQGESSLCPLLGTEGSGERGAAAPTVTLERGRGPQGNILTPRSHGPKLSKDEEGTVVARAR